MFGPFNRTPFNRSFRIVTPASAQAQLVGQSKVDAQATLVSTVDAILSSSSHLLVVSTINLKSVLSSTSSIQANAEAFYPLTSSLDSTSALEANGVIANLAQTTLSSSMDGEFQGVIYRSVSSVLPAVSGIYASAVSYYDVGINEPRYIRGRFGYALIVEEGTTNLIPSAHAFEFKTEWTSPTLDGTYTLSVRDGTGRIQISGAYTGTVSPGEYVTFNVTSGTITLTPEDGIPKLVQLEAKPYPTSFIDGTRANESASINTKDFVNPDEGTIDIWKKEDGRWVLITIVWKNGTATVYRDRVQESTISNYQPPTPVWNLEYGIYDEIRFSSVARSPEEIAAYDLENPLPTDDKTTVKYDFNKRLDAGIGHPYTTILGDLNITGPLPFNITLGPHGILAVDKDGYHTFSIDGEGNAMFAGELVAARGTFVGELQAATGSFTGEITATRAYFTGSINAQNATITGTLIGSAATLQSVDIRNANIINANIQQATITGTLVGVDGTFTGELLGATGTFLGSVRTTSLIAYNDVWIGSTDPDLFNPRIRMYTTSPDQYSSIVVIPWTTETAELHAMYISVYGYESYPNFGHGVIHLTGHTGQKVRVQVNGALGADWIQGYSDGVNTIKFGSSDRMMLTATDSYPHFGLVLGQVMIKGLDGSVQQVQIRNRNDTDYRDLSARDIIANNTIYVSGPNTGYMHFRSTGTYGYLYCPGGDSYIRLADNGEIRFYVNGAARHIFGPTGSKTGGSYEFADGTILGMSPIDSPQSPIEYIIFDVEVTEEGTEIELDERFVEIVDGKYAVFTSATDRPVKIENKRPDRFILRGPAQKIDLRLVGLRKDVADQFWVDMEEHEEELGQPEEVVNFDTENRD